MALVRAAFLEGLIQTCCDVTTHHNPTLPGDIRFEPGQNWYPKAAPAAGEGRVWAWWYGVLPSCVKRPNHLRAALQCVWVKRHSCAARSFAAAGAADHL